MVWRMTQSDAPATDEKHLSAAAPAVGPGRAASRVGDIPVRSAATTGRGRNRLGIDIRDMITALEPILRGWGNYFRTGNAADKFQQIEHVQVSGVLHLLRRRQHARRHRQPPAEALVRQGDVPVCRLTVDHHDPEGPPGRAAPQLMDQLYASHASSEDQHVTIGRSFFLTHIPPEGAGCPRGKDKTVKESLVKAIQLLMRVTLVVIGVSAYRSDLLKLDGEG
jgi:hypothetical protein